MVKEKLESLESGMGSFSNTIAEIAPARAVLILRILAGISLGGVMLSAVFRMSFGIPATILFTVCLVWYLLTKDLDRKSVV